jgi:hypothetical protein
MRAAAVAAIVLLFTPGCANRGMQAPNHDASATGGHAGTGAGGRGGNKSDGGLDATGTAGASGATAGRGGGTAGRGGGSAGTGGRGGTSGGAAGGRAGASAGAGGASAGAGGASAGAGGRGGSGGAGGRAGAGTGGVAGSGGSPIVDAGCGPGDAAVVPGPCNATFNFESGLQGARLGTQTAFQTPVMSSAQGYCGKSLAIPATFTGPTDKGEVIIPLATDGGAMDLTGKTISIAVAADPGCDADLDLFLVINTQSLPVMFPIPAVSGTWQRRSFGPAADVSAAIAISLQAFSVTGYQGTIYVDEIDIR